MAQRITVSIPDALADRLETYKDRVSPSEVFQQALELRIEQLQEQDRAQGMAERLRAFAKPTLDSLEPSYVKAAKKAAHAYLSSEAGVRKILSHYQDFLYYMDYCERPKGPHTTPSISLFNLERVFFEGVDLPKDESSLFIKELANLVIEPLRDAIGERELARRLL
jgi:hypothetical protein